MNKILNNILFKTLSCWLLIISICLIEIYLRNEYSIWFEPLEAITSMMTVLSIPVVLFVAWIDFNQSEDLFCLIGNYFNKVDKAKISKLDDSDYKCMDKDKLVSDYVKYSLTGRKRILPNKKVQYEVDLYVDELTYNYNHIWKFKYKKWIDQNIIYK